MGLFYFCRGGSVNITSETDTDNSFLFDCVFIFIVYIEDNRQLNESIERLGNSLNYYGLLTARSLV